MRAGVFLVVGFLTTVIFLGGAVACKEAATPTPAPTLSPPLAPSPTPPPKPTSTLTPTATPVPSPTPKPAPTPTPVPPLGMKIGERFHDVHTGKLQLKCDFCHAKAVETYRDPLAQVSNPTDKRACLSCHKEGRAQPFYGEEWDKAKVGR